MLKNTKSDRPERQTDREAMNTDKQRNNYVKLNA